MDSLRNIRFTFRKYPLPVSLSVTGVVLAFCAFIILSAQIGFEKNFDKFHPDSDCIYKVELTEIEDFFRSILTPGFAYAVMTSSPHIAAGTVSCPFVGNAYISVSDDEMSRGFKEEVNTVSEDFLDVFGITLVEGDRNVLKSPDKVAIPESLSKKYFGDESALGKMLQCETAGLIRDAKWTVGAVYQDLPGNSQVRNQILVRLPDNFYQNFMASNYICYLRLDSPENVNLVEDNFNRSFDFSKYEGMMVSPIRLVPLADVYFQEENEDSRIFRSGSRMQVNILMIVAVLIILVGVFNFTNFYTSLIPLRLRAINTKKVLGESTGRLRMEIVLETVLLIAVSGIIGILVSIPLSEYMMRLGIVSVHVTLPSNLPLVLLTLLIALAAGVLAGIYPVWFATSYEPATVLKGNFGLTPSGSRIKKILVGLQYVISCSMMILIAFVYLQNRKMSGFDAMFDKDRVAVVELTGTMAETKGTWLAEELKHWPEIEDVAFATEIVGAQDVYMTEGIPNENGDISAFSIWCSYNFLDVMGINVTEGRNFSKNDDPNTVIFNSYAKNNHELALGRIPGSPLEVAGFCNDVKFTSWRQESSPVYFRCLPVEYGLMSIAYIRLKEGFDPVAATAHIKSAIAEIDPVYPAEVMYYDRIINDLYGRENTFARIILWFSMLSIVLSLTGVFSMVIFDIHYKKKEIAVRKIFGADYGNVILSGNKPYFYIVLAGFLIAVPIAYMAVRMYLKSFAIKVDISLWVFLLVFVLIEGLTALLVLWRYHSVAKENVTQSLETK